MNKFWNLFRRKKKQEQQKPVTLRPSHRINDRDVFAFNNDWANEAYKDREPYEYKERHVDEDKLFSGFGGGSGGGGGATDSWESKNEDHNSYDNNDNTDYE